MWDDKWQDNEDAGTAAKDLLTAESTCKVMEATAPMKMYGATRL